MAELHQFFVHVDYVRPVLWMTSYLHIVVSMMHYMYFKQRENSIKALNIVSTPVKFCSVIKVLIVYCTPGLKSAIYN